jgi:hypothetical protein
MDSLEPQILEVGRAVAARFPSAARRPLKALDDKAMDLASADAQLKAALFRFVDVVPACRSLDDLARHLTGFLDEVDDRPASLDVAMRMSGSKAGRAALGAAAAAGVKHMAHRFIVGASPARPPASSRISGSAGSPPPSTCSARRRSPAPRPTATPPAAPPPSTSSPRRRGPGPTGRCSRPTATGGWRGRTSP